MSSQTDISLVIVSQNRPEHLSLLLQSLRHQTHPSFEVVVVADEAPVGDFGDIKYVSFQTPNISAARNEGIRHSSSEIIAFCDDDAIPDPYWLERLVAPFEDVSIGSTTGFTRGRNGISLQWGAMRCDKFGVDHPFDIDLSERFTVFDASNEMPIKLLGTNMAIRRSALLEIEGFDESFKFFLDETDLKFRLDKAGWKCAIVPDAQVQHKYAASERRTEKRVPMDLFEIGASKAHFCKEYSPNEADYTLHTFTTEQLARLIRLESDRKLKKSKVKSLLKGLNLGIVEGKNRSVVLGTFEQTAPPFIRFKTNDREHIVVCARPRDKKWARETARKLVEEGNCVSVIQLLPSPRYFQVSFVDGYWLHKGGTYGKSNRDQLVLQFTTTSKRFTAEIERISDIYPVNTVLRNQ